MRCRFCLPDLQNILFKCNIESKAGYGVDLWGDIDCGTDISIFIAGCVRDYRNLVVACGDAGYDAFVVSNCKRIKNYS